MDTKTLIGCFQTHLILLFLVIIAAVHAAVTIDTGSLDTVRCVWRSSISPTMPPEQKARPRHHCSLGQLRWHYPSGNLSTTFEHSVKSFALCLSLRASNDSDCPLDNFRLLSNDNDQWAAMRTPGAESVVCSSTTTGEVDIIVEVKKAMKKCRTLSITYTRNPP